MLQLPVMVCAASLWICLGSLWLGRVHLRELGKALGPRTLWVVAATLLLWVLLVETSVHHGIWHTMTHGLERVADVRDGDFPINLQHLHGPGWLVTVGLPSRLSGHAIDIFHIAVAWTVAGLAALYILAWQVTGRRDLAWVTLAATAFSPGVMRLSATASLYVPTVALLWMSLAAWERFAQTRARWMLILALTLQLLVHHHRADMFLLAPFMIGSFLALRHAKVLWALCTTPRYLGILALFALAHGPRLLQLTALQDSRAHGGIELWFAPHLGPWLAWFLAISWLILGIIPNGRPLRDQLTWPVTGALVIAATMWLNATTRGLPDLATMSPALSLAQTPSGFVLPAVVGLVAAIPRMPRLAAWASLTMTLTAALYWPNVDSSSTWLRTGLVAWPVYGLLVAIAVGTLADRLAAQRVPSWAVVAAWTLWFGAGVATRIPWLGHLYPRQHEQRLLDQARSSLPPGAVVAYLSPFDVAAHVDPEQFHHVYKRGAIARYLGGQNALAFDTEGTGQAVEAAPWRLSSLQDVNARSDVPVFYLQTLDCYRRIYTIDHQTELRDDQPVPVTEWIAPVLARPELRIPPDSPILEEPSLRPRCMAMHTRFELEPVHIRHLTPGSIGNAMERVWGRSPVIGLYRILGEHPHSGLAPTRSPRASSTR